MWIYYKAGFVSAVELRESPDHLLLRARVQEDLVRVAESLGLDAAAVELNKTSDYAWRLGHHKEVTKVAFGKLMAEAVADIDYDSHVKEELSRPSGKREDDRYTWYMSAWTAGLRVQDKRLGVGTGSSASSMLPLDDELSSFGRGARPRRGRSLPTLGRGSLSELWDRYHSDDDEVVDDPPEVSEARFGPDIPHLDPTTAEAYVRWCDDRGADTADPDAFYDFVDTERLA